MISSGLLKNNRIITSPYHQYLPDRIQYEPGAFTATERRRIEARGHRLQELTDGYGNMQVIYWDRSRDQVQAASDPQGLGKAEVH